MAADFISIPKQSRPNLGTQLISAANKCKELRELIDGLSDAKDHMNDGSSYVVMETQFGIATGSGANAATLIGLMQDIFNSNSTEVTAANRFARMEEFQARLAGQ